MIKYKSNILSRSSSNALVEASCISIHQGLLDQSRIVAFLQANDIPVVKRGINEDSISTYSIGHQRYDFSSPVTFTPYASSKPCSARCWFCSENLREKGNHQSGSTIRPSIHYQQNLNHVLKQIAHIPLGLSFSGLEVTDDASWAMDTLSTLAKKKTYGVDWSEKSAYSNASGFAHQKTSEPLIDAFANFGFERVEISRHHFDETVNQSIMRFRKEQPVQINNVFESTIKALVEKMPVTLVCILQHDGINSFEETVKYVQWASRLGVKKIIFRELCELDSTYQLNRTLRSINEKRVPIEPLFFDWFHFADAEIQYVTDGYYFWNAKFQWDDIEITLERSDYGAMNVKHRSEFIYKLVYFANGHLCRGWSPVNDVIYVAEI